MTQRQAIVKALEILTDVEFAEKEEVLKRLEKIKIQLENKANGGKQSTKMVAEKANKANFAKSFFTLAPQRLKDIIAENDDLRIRFGTVQSLLGAIRPCLLDGSIITCKADGVPLEDGEKVKEKYFKLA